MKKLFAVLAAACLLFSNGTASADGCDCCAKQLTDQPAASGPKTSRCILKATAPTPRTCCDAKNKPADTGPATSPCILKATAPKDQPATVGPATSPCILKATAPKDQPATVGPATSPCILKATAPKDQPATVGPATSPCILKAVRPTVKCPLCTCKDRCVCPIADKLCAEKCTCKPAPPTTQPQSQPTPSVPPSVLKTGDSTVRCALCTCKEKCLCPIADKLCAGKCTCQPAPLPATKRVAITSEKYVGGGEQF